jgi:RNA polymerase sigma factor (sigma-70 family)
MSLRNKLKNENMYRLYDEYKNSMKLSKKARNKRQKINKQIREKYDEPYKRKDHVCNVNDITNWNSMIRDLEEDMKMIEMYLQFEDRHYLHKEYNDVKSMIYNQNSYEGIIPLEEIFGESIKDTTEIVTNVETQEEICELLDEVLTERQKQVIDLYFWQEKTQEEIGEILGLKQNTISQIITNSLEILRDCIDMDEIIDFWGD